MNFADVLNARDIFIKAKNITCAEIFIFVIGVNIYQIDENALDIFFLRDFNCLTKIFCGIVNKKFVGVKKDNPTAFRIFERDIARRRKIIFPSLVKNFRAEFFCDFNASDAESARVSIETWSWTISACYIVKDGAKDLEYSLKSLAEYVDEIIVVDTGSTDDTVEVAGRFGAKIFYETWQNDFATPRNVALKAAKCSWIVFLDADEYFIKGTSKNLREAIKLAQEKNIKGVFVNLINIDADNDNKILGASRVLRLYENAAGVCYKGKIHEQVFIDDELLTSLMTVPNELLTLYHTGYSESIHKAKMERNLKALFEELAVTDNPKRIYGYLAETYHALKDNDNAEKYARLDFDTGETLSDSSTRILLEIFIKGSR